MNRHLKPALFLILFIGWFSCIAYTSQAGPVKRILALKSGSRIRIDGILREPVWQTRGYGNFIQSDPVDGGKPSEKSEVWIAYDKHSLYVAARFHDSQPDKIIARLGRRDDFVDSDWLIFSVDPYFDRRSGYKFALNPAGSICDWVLFNDEEEDITWDGIWESAARITPSGWTAEIRIPFHQLRFNKKALDTWGVNVHRIIKRKNEENLLAWVPKEESGYVSRFITLEGLGGINRGRKIEFFPYLMSRLAITPEEKGNPFETGEAWSANLGLDLKVGLRSNLTLDVTINPDFGQVEVDPAVINISDQETYYAEKRPFFLEGAGIFRFGGGGLNQSRDFGWQNPSLFYSRRIGRSPRGLVTSDGFVKYPDWTNILGAGKITGKIGDGVNLGLLTAFTGREDAEIDQGGSRFFQEIEPFSQYGVLRIQKEFHQGRQGLGLMVTSVNKSIDSENIKRQLIGNAYSLGMDGWTFLDKHKTWVVSGWFSASRVTGSKEAITQLQKSPLHYFQRPDADYVTVDETVTSLDGWAGRIILNKQEGNLVFNAALGAMSPGFDANELGFHYRVDLINGHVQLGYQVFKPGKLFRRWRLSLTAFRNYDFGGTRIGEMVYLTADTQFLNYWNAGLELSYEPEKFSHYFTRGGPMALYISGTQISGDFSSDSRKPMVCSFSGHFRTHPNGAYNWSAYLGLRWKPSPNLSLSITPGYSFRISTGQWITRVEDPLKWETYGVRYILSNLVYKTIPIEIRLNWTFSPKLSLQAYIQPYIVVGDFSRFKELAAAMGYNFYYLGEGASTLEYRDGIYYADPDGPGPAVSFSFPEPDFNFKSLRGTIVLRWEYRPGSTLYLVWTQNREDYHNPGNLDFGRDLKDLLQAEGDHIFMLKLTYRFTI